MPSITKPTRSGYAFAGYYTEQNGSGIQYYDANATTSKVCYFTQNTTLYAKWVLVSNTFTHGSAYASGGQGTEYSGWNTFNTLSSSASGNYIPFDYAAIKALGYTKLDITVNAQYIITGTVGFQIRIVNKTTGEVVGAEQYYENPSAGGAPTVSLTCSVNLSMVNAGDELEIQIRHKKIHFLWGGHFTVPAREITMVAIV